MQLAGIISFSRERLGLAHLATGHDIREVAIQTLDQSMGRRIIKTNHQVTVDEAVRMKVTIKGRDLVDGGLGARDDFEKGHFSLDDVASAHYVISKKLLPARPVGTVRQVHQNNRHEVRFAGLRQGDRLQQLVVGAEAAGEDDYRVGFLDEHELACEEEVKVHELRIVADERVGSLLRRQTNIHAETSFSPGAFMPG